MRISSSRELVLVLIAYPGLENGLKTNRFFLGVCFFTVHYPKKNIYRRVRPRPRRILYFPAMSLGFPNRGWSLPLCLTVNWLAPLPLLSPGNRES